MTEIAAGFECAHMGGRCLLAADRHVPEDRMAAHYAALAGLGIRTVRDGLPPWMDPAPRLRVAREAGAEVIWDIDHWWGHRHPVTYARRLAEAARAEGAGPLRVCINETAMSYRFARQRRATAVRLGRQIVTALRAELPDVRLVTSEPAHHLHEIEHHAGLADLASVIGLNLYPYHLTRRVEEMLQAAARRYPGHRIAVTETGSHDGWHRRARPDLFPPDMRRADWLRHVLGAVERSGVDVAFVCLYPAIDGLSWSGSHRNASGLMTPEAEVHAGLAGVLRGAGERLAS